MERVGVRQPTADAAGQLLGLISWAGPAQQPNPAADRRWHLVMRMNRLHGSFVARLPGAHAW